MNKKDAPASAIFVIHQEFNVVQSDHTVPETHIALMCAISDQHHVEHEQCLVHTLTLAHSELHVHQVAALVVEYSVV